MPQKAGQFRLEPKSLEAWWTTFMEAMGDQADLIESLNALENLKHSKEDHFTRILRDNDVDNANVQSSVTDGFADLRYIVSLSSNW